VPLVLDSPHSGFDIPTTSLRAGPRGLRQAEDSYVDELYASGPDVGAILIAARFPRSYIDPNRSVLDIDASLLEAPWPDRPCRAPRPRAASGSSGACSIPARRSIPEVERRRGEEPHRALPPALPAAVKNALDRAHRHFGAVWHLNLHSMPAVSSAVSDEGPGKSRADFVLGDRDGSTCEPQFTAMWPRRCAAWATR
jgi:N-formylglutamate amidohydrolase